MIGFQINPDAPPMDIGTFLGLSPQLTSTDAVYTYKINNNGTRNELRKITALRNENVKPGQPLWDRDKGQSDE